MLSSFCSILDFRSSTLVVIPSVKSSFFWARLSLNPSLRFSRSSLVTAIMTSSRFWIRSISSFAFSIFSSTSRRSRAALKDNAKSAPISAVSTSVTGVRMLSGMDNTRCSMGLWINSVIRIVRPPHASEDPRQICPWKLNLFLE